MGTTVSPALRVRSEVAERVRSGLEVLAMVRWGQGLNRHVLLDLARVCTVV